MSGYFAEQIQAARIAAGLTQQQLGDRAGILRHNVSRLESGQHPVKEDTLERIAAALGLEMAQLVVAAEKNHTG